MAVFQLGEVRGIHQPRVHLDGKSEVKIHEVAGQKNICLHVEEAKEEGTAFKNCEIPVRLSSCAFKRVQPIETNRNLQNLLP